MCIPVFSLKGDRRKCPPLFETCSPIIVPTPLFSSDLLAYMLVYSLLLSVLGNENVGLASLSPSPPLSSVSSEITGILA